MADEFPPAMPGGAPCEVLESSRQSSRGQTVPGTGGGRGTQQWQVVIRTHPARPDRQIGLRSGLDPFFGDKRAEADELGTNGQCI